MSDVSPQTLQNYMGYYTINYVVGLVENQNRTCGNYKSPSILTDQWVLRTLTETVTVTVTVTVIVTLTMTMTVTVTVTDCDFDCDCDCDSNCDCACDSDCHCDWNCDCDYDWKCDCGIMTDHTMEHMLHDLISVFDWKYGITLVTYISPLFPTNNPLTCFHKYQGSSKKLWGARAGISSHSCMGNQDWYNLTTRGGQAGFSFPERSHEGSPEGRAQR